MEELKKVRKDVENMLLHDMREKNKFETNAIILKDSITAEQKKKQREKNSIQKVDTSNMKMAEAIDKILALNLQMLIKNVRMRS